MIKRGFVSPTENQFKRAKTISELEFVDWVIISKKLAHDPWCLKLIKPKFVIFQQDNSKYLKKLFSVLSKRFPKTIFKKVPFRREFSSFPGKDSSAKSAQIVKIISNEILKKLVISARKSNAPIGKISAILTKNGKIISEKCNSSKGEHAEMLILKEKVLFKSSSNKYILHFIYSDSSLYNVRRGYC